MLESIGQKAQNAARALMHFDNAARSRALHLMAAYLEQNEDNILAANAEDMAASRKDGLAASFLDRLLLNDKRIRSMAEGLRSVADLPDPLDRLLWETTRPNGLNIKRLSSPMGVIAVIFEARPNVTADSAALSLKAGSAIILRGGKEAIRSNTAIVTALRNALEASGLPKDAVQLVEDVTRASAEALMTLKGYVDLLIPRGGAGLIRTTVENATVPVLQTGEGVCHVYVDKDADIKMAVNIMLNAKTSRPSVCNAAEALLVHKDIAPAAMPILAQALRDAHVTLHGDERARALFGDMTPAAEEDWGHEFLDLTLAVKVVDDMQAALDHISRYGTKHSETIVTDNRESASAFLKMVDAAAVYHNASTRFTDGAEFGFGAEIGISTQKLHARGPVGLNELTTYKYVIEGNGQVR